MHWPCVFYCFFRFQTTSRTWSFEVLKNIDCIRLPYSHGHPSPQLAVTFLCSLSLNLDVNDINIFLAYCGQAVTVGKSIRSYSELIYHIHLCIMCQSLSCFRRLTTDWFKFICVATKSFIKLSIDWFSISKLYRLERFSCLIFQSNRIFRS